MATMHDPDIESMTISQVLRDEETFTLVFEFYRPGLLSFARTRQDARLSGRLDPEDIVQNAFLSALRWVNVGSSPSVDGVYPWLRVKVLDCITAEWRWHRAHKRDIARERSVEADSSAASLAELLTDSITRPSEAMRRGERRERLEKEIERLSEKERSLLIQIHTQGRSFADIAREQKVSGEAIRRQWNRVLQKLGDRLGDGGTLA